MTDTSRHARGPGALPIRPTRIRDVVTVWSRLRYVSWRIRKGKRPLIVTLHSNLKIILRPPPARDLTTAHDIFVSEIYEAGDRCGAGKDSLIVDVGANVGYSCLYFASHFRESRLLAFEPHPVFAQLFERQMALNGFTSRVTLIAAAADTMKGTRALTDAEDASSIVGGPAEGTIAVRSVDFFEAVGNRSVSLLKIDVEGGEFPLLADARFEKLDVRMILLEWHEISGSGKGRTWCVERLEALGFAVEPGKQDGPDTGLLTAIRE